MIRAALVAVVLVGCGAPAVATNEADATHDITGTFALVSATVNRNADLTRCDGTGGYDDIGGGTGVVLRDGDGNVVGSSELAIADREAFGNTPGCVYTFTFADVPDVPFYAVEVGDRGEIVYSRADLAGAGWRITASLGD